MTSPRRTGAALAALLLLAGLASADWTFWRGPAGNGTTTDTGLPETWSPAEVGKNNLIWKAPFGCRATPLVMNGRVYLNGSFGKNEEEGERLVCLDAKTGEKKWEQRFNVWHTDIVTNRVAWTNLTADPKTGRVFMHGTQGYLMALDGESGKILWKRSLTEEFGRVTGYGGRVVSPLFVDGLVIMGMVNASWGDQAPGDNRLVAFDAENGNVVWWSVVGGRGTYTSSPVPAVMNGKKVVVTGTAGGQVVAVEARTGKKEWAYTFGSGQVDGTPVVDGNLVYAGHGIENVEPGIPQGRIICLDASKLEPVKDAEGKTIGMTPTLVWENTDGVKAGYATPTLAEGKLYISDDSAKLFAFDAKTGKSLWRRPTPYGKVARGSAVYGEGKLYIFDVNGYFHILKPGEKGADEAKGSPVRFRGEGGTFVETNGTPAVSDGNLFITTIDECFCIGTGMGKAGPAPKLPEEAALPPGTAPDFALVYPNDVLLKPGDSVQFEVRLYAKGLPAGVAKAEWSLPAPPLPPGGKVQPPPLDGTVEAGKFTAGKKPAQQGYVEAKVGGLTARARVRVAPLVPYSQDFEKVPEGSFIAGSVNCQGKFVVREIDDGMKKNKVLVKLAVNAAAPVARSNAYITPPDASDYTIQADVMGRAKEKNRSDVGVVANRYTLSMLGNEGTLRLASWDARKRVVTDQDFKWKEDTWYTLKLTVAVKDGKGVVKGKVWEQGKPEPAEWTITLDDPLPNTEGAAALYGYQPGDFNPESPGPECLFDNVIITPNPK